MNQAEPKLDYREILRAEFLKRRQAEPFYSLRKYAKDMGFTVQHLSNVFQGKRGIGASKAHKIAAELNFKPLEKRAFLALVASQSGRSVGVRSSGRAWLRKSYLIKIQKDMAVNSIHNLPPLPPIIKKLHLRPVKVCGSRSHSVNDSA